MPAIRSIAPRSKETRTKLIEAAERLFAQRGISSISVREITLAAGQKNNSALCYHFGSKEGLLQAILSKHAVAQRARRSKLFDRILSDDALDDVRRLCEVLVRPFADFLAGGRSEHAYLCIASELYSDPSRSYEHICDMYDDPLISRIVGALLDSVPLPTTVLHERLITGVGQVMHAAASRARLEDSGVSRDPRTPIPLFVANLIDMFVAATMVPPSKATLQTLSDAGAVVHEQSFGNAGTRQ